MAKRYEVYGINGSFIHEPITMEFDDPKRGDCFRYNKSEYRIGSVREHTDGRKTIEVQRGVYYMPEPFDDFTWETYVYAAQKHVEDHENDYIIVKYDDKFMINHLFWNDIVVSNDNLWLQNPNGSKLSWKDVVHLNDHRKIIELLSIKIAAYNLK